MRVRQFICAIVDRRRKTAEPASIAALFGSKLAMSAGLPVGAGPSVAPQGLANDPPVGEVGSHVGMKPW